MKYTLKELLDIPRLRELLDSFDEIHSMPSAIIDIEGKVLTATAWQDICSKFHRVHPETEKKCIESDIHIRAAIDHSLSDVIYCCPMGLVDSAVPIIIDGEHLGNVFTGQLFIEPPDESRFVAQARQYGFDETAYLAAMRNVPYFSKAHLHRNLTFIHRLTKMLAEQGLQQKRLIEAESALRESERRVSDALDLNDCILNTSSVGILSYHASGRCIFANEFAAKMVGTSVSELLSQNFHRIAAWKSSGMYETACSVLASDCEQEMEVHIVSSFGKDIWSNVRFSTFQSKGEKCLLVFTLDISGRKLADEKLISNERFLRMLTDNIPGMVGYWTRDLLCTFANKAYLEWFDKTQEQMMGISIQELLGAELFRKNEPYIRRALNGELQHFERTLVKTSGETGYTWSHYIPDRIDGQTRGFFVLVSDITELKRAEYELKESLLLNRQMINCAQEGIILHDRDLRYQVWNPFMEKMTGVPAADVLGKHPLNIFPFLKESGSMEQIEKALAGETMPGAEFFFNIEDTGKSGWTYNTAAPLKTESGEIMGVIRTLSDITSHRRLEDQLRQSQKIEALGQLAGGVAHDFNNALQIIIGYTSLLGINATHEQNEYLQEIVAAAERAAELTSGLLSYSSKQVFKLEKININKLITYIERFLRRILGEDISLIVQQAAEPLVATVDKSHFQQVFINMASNARDAMLSGGKLSIQLNRLDMDENFVHTHGFGTVGPYAWITVSDTGDGILPEYLHKIFEPFFSTKAEGKGTGLGLAIVYGIVTQHNGFINCYSEVGVGTTFNIYLPLAHHTVPSIAPKAEEQCNFPLKLTILLVEDDPAVRKVTRSMLEIHGGTVIEAQDGKEALAIFKQKHAAIQLVILDALMPDMNGAETLAALQEIVPDIKALILSGYAQNLISGKMAIPENVTFLNKPVIPARLMEAIRKTMG
jgi:PAS domain S-box-containing protein